MDQQPKDWKILNSSPSELPRLTREPARPSYNRICRRTYSRNLKARTSSRCVQHCGSCFLHGSRRYAMDWAKLIKDRARVSGLLRVEELTRDLGLSEAAIRNSLRRQEGRGLVEHVGKKIFINRLASDFSGRELINVLRPDAYLSLETVLRDSGVSTQTATVLTCVTPERAGEFRSESISIVFRRLSKNLFWGFHEKRTRYGNYNIADPEKALLDWVY